ncbi:MAG: hypothetical protein PHS57_09375 [Alphaproteobacteria bacterium]|nr:hypothetical protein [Alphaproteobacteria bacterium]
MPTVCVTKRHRRLAHCTARFLIDRIATRERGSSGDDTPIAGLPLAGGTIQKKKRMALRPCQQGQADQALSLKWALS